MKLSIYIQITCYHLYCLQVICGQPGQMGNYQKWAASVIIRLRKLRNDDIKHFTPLIQLWNSQYTFKSLDITCIAFKWPVGSQHKWEMIRSELHMLLSDCGSCSMMTYSILRHSSNYETLNIHTNHLISLVLPSSHLWAARTNGKWPEVSCICYYQITEVAEWWYTAFYCTHPIMKLSIYIQITLYYLYCIQVACGQSKQMGNDQKWAASVIIRVIKLQNDDIQHFTPLIQLWNSQYTSKSLGITCIAFR